MNVFITIQMMPNDSNCSHKQLQSGFGFDLWDHSALFFFLAFLHRPNQGTTKSPYFPEPCIWNFFLILIIIFIFLINLLLSVKSSKVLVCQHLPPSHQLLFVQGRLCGKPSTLDTGGRRPEILIGPPWPLTQLASCLSSFPSTPHLPSFFPLRRLRPWTLYPSSHFVPICHCGCSSHYTFISLPLFSVYPVHRAECKTFLSSAVSVPLPDGWIVEDNSSLWLCSSGFSPDVQKNGYISWLGGRTLLHAHF